MLLVFLSYIFVLSELIGERAFFALDEEPNLFSYAEDGKTVETIADQILSSPDTVNYLNLPVPDWSPFRGAAL